MTTVIHSRLSVRVNKIFIFNVTRSIGTFKIVVFYGLTAAFILLHINSSYCWCTCDKIKKIYCTNKLLVFGIDRNISGGFTGGPGGLDPPPPGCESII